MCGLDRLDNWMASLISDHGLPHAATLVARKGKVVYYKGTGEQSPEVPLRSDSIYRIYSMTKPITSLALMMLVEEGRVLLDQPVHLFLGKAWKKQNMNVLAGFGKELEPCTRTITIKMLLLHTSGLTYGFDGVEKLHPVDGLYQESNRKHIKLNESSEEFVNRLASLPLCFQPGTKWNYSYSIDVIGRIVEVVSKQSLGDFFHKRILGPLKMNETSFRIKDDLRDRFTNIHFQKPDGAIIDVTHLQMKNNEYLEFKHLESGGGGLLSTMKDYCRFCHFLLNGGELEGVRLLGRHTMNFATTNHLLDNQDCRQLSSVNSMQMSSPGIGFGLGFAVVMDPLQSSTMNSKGTFYWSGAASTLFWIDPVEELVVLFHTQVLAIDDLKLPLRNFVNNIVYGSIADGEPYCRL